MLLSADIPPHKLGNPAVRDFFKEYCKEALPDESTVRKVYIPAVYEEKMTELREVFKDQYLWASIDETTDEAGRYIVNVVAGPLDGSYRSYLIDVQYVRACNHSTIAHVLVEALKSLLGIEEAMAKVLILLTDSAAYMHKMAKGVAVLLPNCLHITCLAHGVHRIAETVRSSYPLVDKLVSSVKKVFTKAPSRRSLFVEMHPNIRLPPQPVVTRWGTWISAVLYYAENYEAVKRVVDALDPSDAAAIGSAQELMTSQKLREELAYIAHNFSDIPRATEELQRRDIKASSALKVYADIAEKVSVHPEIKEKMIAVTKRNASLPKLSAILRVTVPDSPLVEGSDVAVPSLPPAALVALSRAPLTTAQVERCFSKYKAVLRWNRLSFKEENLRQYFIIHCNCSQ